MNNGPTIGVDPLVVLAPLGRDAATACRVLRGGGIDCTTVDDAAGLLAVVRDGRLSGALIAEEALTADGVAALAEALAGQPSWSDLPVLLLMADESQSTPRRGSAVERLRAAGNVVLLVRPVPSVALITAAQAARRARQRQYEVRDLIGREQQARHAAEQADRLKDQFLATVSHELRTPLTAILIWSKLAAAGQLDDSELPQAMSSIESSARMQSRLIEDLLDISRLVDGRLRISATRIELAPIAEQAVEVVRPVADAKAVRLEVRQETPAGPVHGDPHRLQQVLINLLTNAVKFTPAGGRVTVTVCCDGREACVRVADTGRGIAPEFLPHVFERFRQDQDASTRRHDGLGLGLSIAQQLVSLHGGTLTAHSDGVGRGATFVMHLPQIAAAVTREAGPRLAGVRVLLADGDEAMRLALKRLLQDAGAEVSAVDTAAAALTAFRASTNAARPPHVLISDIARSGTDACRLVRSLQAEALRDDNGRRLPAIAISAYVTERGRAEAAAAGFSACLDKPIDAGRLIDAIDRVAAPSRSED